MATHFSDEQVLWFNVWYYLEMNCRCDCKSKQYQRYQLFTDSVLRFIYVNIELWVHNLLIRIVSCKRTSLPTRL